MKLKISQSDTLWYAFSFLISVLFAGSMNGFRFRDSITFQLHDGYYAISMSELTWAIFLLMGFVVLLAISIKNGFKELSKLWLLLIHCALTLVSALYFFYITYSITMGIVALEYMDMPAGEQPSSSLLMNTVRIFLVIIGILIIGLLLMIRRIKAVKKGL